MTSISPATYVRSNFRLKTQFLELIKGQHGLAVYYDDEVMGEFVADVLVEDAVILE